MRITKLLFTIAAFAFITSNSFANENPSDISVRNEIKEMIQDASLQYGETESLVVNFLINSQNEIIVVSTNDKMNESAIRSALELKKVKGNDLVKNKLYTLPIQVEKM